MSLSNDLFFVMSLCGLGLGQPSHKYVLQVNCVKSLFWSWFLRLDQGWTDI